MSRFILILFIPIQTFAFLDFVGDQAKQAIETAAYIDAAAELSNEIVPDKELQEGAKQIRKRAETLRSQASDVRSISETTRSVLNGPDWSSKRLDTNIRATTDYIRRLKRLIARVVGLGLAGTIALNTTETNIALTEVQKNQQALILQNEDRNLRDMEREREEAHQWAQFSEQQRARRQRRQ